MAARATGIAVLCCALASCQAFHAPFVTKNSALSPSRHGTRGQQQCYRRSHEALSMKEDATAEASVVEEGSGAPAAAQGQGAKQGGRPGLKKQELYKNQPKPVSVAQQHSSIRLTGGLPCMLDSTPLRSAATARRTCSYDPSNHSWLACAIYLCGGVFGSSPPWCVLDLNPYGARWLVYSNESSATPLQQACRRQKQLQ